MAQTFDIELNGETITVSGEYTPGEDAGYDCPGTGSEFFVESIICKGVEVLPIINDSDLENIINKVIHKIEVA